ncbi:Nramp family divalent metal transporter [Ferruginibacter sp. HRS2-29]|uniref:Nramp family divalent metal transporter n=1 Tax=Ferruginibacter sp. HRS2-29 TaxID=2487334 RepID=UPI0020CF87C0|nr:Nramp family divalent metal transporter [Ferruginibacter sp. HRS2-29]MCP9752289.1 iron/manganese transporter [Ferruginibacter sp. HRS2-29]
MKITHIGYDNSLGEVHGTVDTISPKKGWRKIFSFLGPAYLVSVGYMDPGNWATDLAGGSKYGYSLIWVLLMSNLMALLLQGLSARLGIVRGRDLAQANREAYPKYVNFILYILAEIAIAACDLAEVLGMAIGIQLLTGLPLIWGVSITVLDTFLLLYLQKLGMRKMEAFIIALVAIIALAFLVQVIQAGPVVKDVVKGFVPSIPDKQALFIAIGIIGATVMPHNLYLHSALVQSRKIDRSDFGIRQALKFNRIDTTIALNIAFFVNAGILILAASVFFTSGNSHIAEIKDAHQLLPKFLGNTAPVLFAVALIAAGQSSTVTGTLAGQIIMEGYLSLRINPWLRRLITRLIAITPAIIVILIYGEDEVTALLLMSQVVLSMQLGFAIIPLIHFVSDKKTMGKFVIRPITQIAAWLIASVLVFLNVKMLVDQAMPVFSTDATASKIALIAAGLFFGGLLFYIIFFPYINKKRLQKSIAMHNENVLLPELSIPVYKKIAVALDFSENDPKILSAAFGQGSGDTNYLLLHIVESASAKLHGKESDDYETRKDKERMELYVRQLSEKGYHVRGQIGFRSRVKEIVRIVVENDADMLVIGAHGHAGLKDLLYGETVNAVRHELKVPVLVVTL